MIGWGIFGLYMIGYIMTARRIVYVAAWDMKSSFDAKPLREDWLFGLVAAFFVAWVWPLTILLYWLYHNTGIVSIARFAKAPKTVGKKQDRAAMQRRIDELERELGIGRESLH